MIVVGICVILGLGLVWAVCREWQGPHLNGEWEEEEENNE